MKDPLGVSPSKGNQGTTTRGKEKGSILPHKFAVLGVVCGADTNAKVVYQS